MALITVVGKCLLRGTDWFLIYSRLRFVFKRLNYVLYLIVSLIIKLFAWWDCIIDFSVNTSYYIPTCAREEFPELQMRTLYRVVRRPLMYPRSLLLFSGHWALLPRGQGSRDLEVTSNLHTVLNLEFVELYLLSPPCTFIAYTGTALPLQLF